MSASYSGDATYQGSRGPALTAGGGSTNSAGSIITKPVLVTVTSSTCPDFSLAPSGTGVSVSGNSGSLTVNLGGTIPAVTITATPTNNFTGTVSFSATATSTSGFQPTFTFSPAAVSISSSAAVTTSLTLTGITADLHMPIAPGQIDSGTMLAQHKAGKAPWYAAGSGAAIASMLLLVLPRRRRLGGLLLVLLAIGLIGGASGCGGSSQSAPPTTTTNTNPYAGTYAVTVIGAYTGSTGTVTQHVANISYVIF